MAITLCITTRGCDATQLATAGIGLGTAVIGTAIALLAQNTIVALWAGLVILCLTPGCAIMCWHPTQDPLTRLLAVLAASMTWSHPNHHDPCVAADHQPRGADNRHRRDTVDSDPLFSWQLKPWIGATSIGTPQTGTSLEIRATIEAPPY